jgi:hypothetical protein
MKGYAETLQKAAKIESRFASSQEIHELKPDSPIGEVRPQWVFAFCK